MVTTKINIKQHLAEYAKMKFFTEEHLTAIRIPDKFDLYHTIDNLTEKRPINAQKDEGNLEIILPERRGGKDPVTYNYLGYRSHRIIESKIEVIMWAEIHDFLDEQKHRYGIEYIDTIHTFFKKYSINSISEDALLKNYYRWRNNVRKKKKRNYKKS